MHITNTRRVGIVRGTAAAIAMAALTLGACGGDDDEASTVTEAPTAADTSTASGDTISIESFSFVGVDSVPAGTVLTVVNNDTTTHTLTADDGSFDSGAINPGDHVEITLDAPGTYTFACAFHPAMTGTITVTG